MSNSQHLKILNMLYEITHEVIPVGNASIASAIIYKKNIIAVGINQKKSHTFQKRFGKDHNCIYLHSEISCIKNSLRHLNEKELSKSTLYICRGKPSGWKLSKPCIGCQRAIFTFNIKNVIYTLNGTGKYEKY